MSYKITYFNQEISNGALKGKELPKRLKVLDWGKSDTTKGDIILNDASYDNFMDNQKQWGRDKDIAIDFDHCTVPSDDNKNFVPGKAKDIAGYGDPELIKGDGLYLKNIRWTDIGKEKAKNYADLSPAVKCYDKSDIVEALHSVALTPNGSVFGLKFYNSDFMINKTMSVPDYNVKGANAGVNQVGDKYEIVTHPKSADVDGDLDENKEHDPNDPECDCADCKSADNMIDNFSAFLKYCVIV